jgi:hypothetical protein
MLTPEERAALRQAWRAGIAAEMARRAAGIDDAGRDATERFFDELEEAGRRALAVSRPGGTPMQEIAKQLAQAVAAKDWERVVDLRMREDLAPIDAVALILLQSRPAAERMLRQYMKGDAPWAETRFSDGRIYDFRGTRGGRSV